MEKNIDDLLKNNKLDKLRNNVEGEYEDLTNDLYNSSNFSKENNDIFISYIDNTSKKNTNCKNYQIDYQKIDIIPDWIDIAEYTTETQVLKNKLFNFHSEVIAKINDLDLGKDFDYYLKKESLDKIKKTSNSFTYASLNFKKLVKEFLLSDFKKDQAPFFDHLIILDKANKILKISDNSENKEIISNEYFSFTNTKNHQKDNLNEILTIYNLILILSKKKQISKKIYKTYKSIIKTENFGIKDIQSNVKNMLSIKKVTKRNGKSRSTSFNDYDIIDIDSSDENEDLDQTDKKLTLKKQKSNKNDNYFYKSFVNLLANYYVLTEENNMYLAILNTVFSVNFTEYKKEVNFDQTSSQFIKKSLLKFSSILVGKLSSLMDSTIDAKKLAFMVLSALTVGQFEIQSLVFSNLTTLLPFGSILMNKFFKAFSNYLGSSSESISIKSVLDPLNDLLNSQKNLNKKLYSILIMMLLLKIEKRQPKKELLLNELKKLKYELLTIFKDTDSFDEFLTKEGCCFKDCKVLINGEEWIEL